MIGLDDYIFLDGDRIVEDGGFRDDEAAEAHAERLSKRENAEITVCKIITYVKLEKPE